MPLVVVAVCFCCVDDVSTAIYKIHILTIQSLRWLQITILFTFSVLMLHAAIVAVVVVINHERA